MNRPGRGQRHIIRQGYLKKVSNSRKLTRTFKKPERRWVVFGILGGHEPYLEYYSSEEGVFTAPPLSYISLLTCKYVSHAFISTKYQNNFTIITEDRIVDLIAPTRNVMLEWCSIIERKLKSLHILSESKENDYEISRIPRRQNHVESVIQVSRDYSQPLDSQDTERPRTGTPSSIPTSPAPLPPESAEGGAAFFGDSSSLPNSPAPVPPSDAPEQVFFSEADLNQPPVIPPRPPTTFSSPQTSEESLTNPVTPPPPPRSNSSGSRSSGGSTDRPASSDLEAAAFRGKFDGLESLRRPGRDPKSPLPPPPLATKKSRRPPPPLPVPRPLSTPIIPPLPPLPVNYPETSATLSRVDDLRKRPLPPPPLPEKSESVRRRSQLLLRSESWESSSDSSRGNSFSGPARDSYSSEDSSDHIEVCHLVKPLSASASASAQSTTGSQKDKEAVSYATVIRKDNRPADRTKSPEVVRLKGKSPTKPLPALSTLPADDTKPKVRKYKETSPVKPTPAPRSKKSLQTVTPTSDTCQTHNLPLSVTSSLDGIPQESKNPADINQKQEIKSECGSGISTWDQSVAQAFQLNECVEIDRLLSSDNLYQTPKTLTTKSKQNLVIPPSSFSTEVEDFVSTLTSTDLGQTLSAEKSTSASVSAAVKEPKSKDSVIEANSHLADESDVKFVDNLIDFDVNDNQLKSNMNQVSQEDTYQSLWNGASPLSTARPTGRVSNSSAPNAIAPPPIVPRRSAQQSPSTNGNAAGSPNGASRQLMVVSGCARPAGDESSLHLNGSQYGARVPVGQPIFLCDEDEENGEVAAATAGTPNQSQQSRLRGFNRTSTTPSPPPSDPISPLVAPVYPQTPDGARGATGGATYLPRPEVVRENSSPSVLPPKMLEAMALDDPIVGGWNHPPGEEGAPPPYLPRTVLNQGASKSLKESQVELLKKEMGHPGGVRVMLRRVDCHHTLALLDCCNGVWVGGWNQEARPFLHNAFHVGDKVISINGQVVENVKMANKLIKHCSNEDKITFILHRLPHARVFALKREEDGQSLGIRRVGGTNEIENITPYGLAAKHNIPAMAPTLDGTNLCNWWITEVNNRPVSLFYKNNEVEHRLNAVGKDITVLIQPTELVQEFRNQLKLIKNYKDFVVQ